LAQLFGRVNAAETYLAALTAQQTVATADYDSWVAIVQAAEDLLADPDNASLQTAFTHTLTTELRGALKNIASTYQNTLMALVTALDAREHETSDHSQRVVQYTSAIALRMGIKGAELDEIGRGALLHDIGKIGVPDAVLLKPGKLTPEEWVEMRKHPDIGHQMIAPIEFLAIPATIVLAHQERWDSQGYPRNLGREAIPIGARIFAVADTLDAMTSDRPYRKGTSFANAISEISRCGGSQFDPEVVRAFLDIGEEGLIRIKAEMIARKAELQKRNEELLKQKKAGGGTTPSPPPPSAPFP
jgi:HD-GYP domain-containing protein (c-di-GMP phosphodiesterase class II)